ncbi:U3 small nucleolar ribonucleoprotein protein IMP3-like [Lineus longissimus]|uniref:U3 small nucleolar ribonucleoprotein protein IMP3-like n=1 Tax=Lineus longissimus TaxID=88925 RepID=UPI002B4D6E46
MVRKLKFHEKKLLKKVDFISWDVDRNLREVAVMRKYYIQRREDYTKYNKLSRHVRELARKIRDLEPKDPYKAEASNQLLDKLYSIGLISATKNLEIADKVSASSFCRRRLPVIMVKSQMAETLKAAVTFIEQGHIRCGPEVVMDPAFLVTRNLEDFVTWTDTSAIRKHVLEYNEIRDDFDMFA